MRVRTLLEILSKVNPDNKIEIWYDNGCRNDIKEVYTAEVPEYYDEKNTMQYSW